MSDACTLDSAVDLTISARYFETLFHAISKHNLLPKPPSPGEALEHYGSGVHAFRNGNLNYALKKFTDAIQLDSENSLFYYYRAVTYRRMGDDVSAERDARVGSYYEAETPDSQRRRIDGAMQFVQGELRGWLENFRLGDPHYDPIQKAQRRFAETSCLAAHLNRVLM